LRAKTICSSVNRDFFIGTTSVQGSVYHAGILFLNGAGFWVRVTGLIIYQSPLLNIINIMLIVFF
ncbi:hypothetical protein J1781_01320, partial [Rahnella sp. C60]|uniref:hypothetical protein n=1 Tax=Rahnella perminowiae TaxID=2816244 RepID=UPI001C28011E